MLNYTDTLDNENSRVYVRVNEYNEVVEVNSSNFITDYTGWVYIDEGNGDRYAHAQNHYFGKPLISQSGIYNYYLLNGIIMDRGI